MIKYLRHFVAGLLIFAGLTTLFANIYVDMENNYGITRDVNQSNIMEEINDINIITSINSTAAAVYSLSNPTNTFDLLGAMALVGVGVIKIIGSTILLPFEIFGVLTSFYYIPPVVVTMTGVLIIIYIGFILISAYMKEKI